MKIKSYSMLTFSFLIACNNNTLQPVTRDVVIAHPANYSEGGTRDFSSPNTNTIPNDMRLVDGIVGQLNGAPVSAANIFAPITEQLTAQGDALSLNEFAQQAAILIRGRLREHIIDQLIIADAMRDLNLNQQSSLQIMVENYRKELIREYGMGSPSQAQANHIIKHKGVTIDARIEEFKESMAVRFYLNNKLDNQIHVDRREIERYYADNSDTFNQPAHRSIRIIRADNAIKSNQVLQRLYSNHAFENIARDAELNNYNVENAGNWPEEIVGEPDFSLESLNIAVANLTEEHMWTGPIVDQDQYYFVELIAYTPPVITPLSDIELDIRDILYNIERNKLSLKLRAQTYINGSFTDPTQMESALLEIAIHQFYAGELATQ